MFRCTGFSCGGWGSALTRSWSFLPRLQVLLLSLRPPWPRRRLGEQWAGHVLRLRARPFQADALPKSCLTGTRDSSSELQGPWPPLTACAGERGVSVPPACCLPHSGLRAGFHLPGPCLGGGRPVRAWGAVRS